MATHSATPWWNGLRHPIYMVFKRWSERASTRSDRSPEIGAAPVHDCQSSERLESERLESERLESERLERIAAYARSGYFNTEYTVGMFVVPLGVPLE
jgi:hypothetical protein